MSKFTTWSFKAVLILCIAVAMSATAVTHAQEGDPPPPDPTINPEKEALAKAVERAQIAVDETEAERVAAEKKYDAYLTEIATLYYQLGVPAPIDPTSDAYKAWYDGLSAENKKKLDDLLAKGVTLLSNLTALERALVILKARLQTKKDEEEAHCKKPDDGGGGED